MSVNRYQISVQNYIDYHKEGYIIVRGLVSEDEVDEIRFHTEELMRGDLTIDGVDPPPQGVTSEQMAQHWLRITCSTVSISYTKSICFNQKS